jgi:hypothetical protein
MNNGELRKLREKLIDSEILSKEVMGIYSRHLIALKDIELKAKTGEFPSCSKFMESLNTDININFRLSAFHSTIIEVMEKNNRQILDYVDSLCESNH